MKYPKRNNFVTFVPLLYNYGTKPLFSPIKQRAKMKPKSSNFTPTIVGTKACQF